MNEKNENIETLDELKDRMKKDGIEYLDPGTKGQCTLIVEPPKRIFDVENRQILYYVIVEIVDKDIRNIQTIKDTDNLTESLKYTILDEETVGNMYEQVMYIKKLEDLDNSNIYV